MNPKSVRVRFDPNDAAKVSQDALVNAILDQVYPYLDPEVEVGEDSVLLAERGVGVFGIPLRVSKEQAKTIQGGYDPNLLDTEQDLAVYEDSEGFWMLSDSGSPRKLINVRHRVLVARQLGCSYVVEGGRAKWIGERVLHVDG